MSDSIRTDEIEKFLSSVRGFVSSQPAAPQRRRVKSELLVLTPANRVDDEADSDAMETAETPMEYSRIAQEPVSNVHHLDVGKQPERENLEATIAELEAAVTSPEDAWDDDDAEDFPVEVWDEEITESDDSDSSKAVEEAPEPDVTGVAEPDASTAPPEVEQKDADPTLSPPDIASQIAHEVAKAFGVREVAHNIMNDMEDDTLRVMVTEIIRDELAGELGEKITRNVRKLVRREINRAFMARGLD
ncbi:hypothetical protein SLH49_05695 [Cognatiyoonia sp. IB215446]|uniref:hypothetical protein n=1 Tax=Cognatiyoonia sp. IB215446 TaxID=3097355 RepID=UPI002A0DA074|nr:hypothetical protein [Cognatiyoonia sp. IB215446]MDX8347475.1 hypothetical protein [Cognatiyoonia sp. IB215446]